MMRPRRGRSRRRGALLGLVAFGSAVALLAGCLPLGLGGGSRAPVELGGEVLMIAPFRMPNAAYFQSDVGAYFARQIAELIRGELPKAKLLTVENVPVEITELTDAERERLSPVRVAKDMGARYVLFGEIYVLRGKEPKSFGVLRGTMSLSARVVDLEENRVVWRLEPVAKKYFYPPLLGGIEPVPADEKDEGEVVRKVMLRAAVDLAAVFTGKKMAPGQDGEEKAR